MSFLGKTVFNFTSPVVEVSLPRSYSVPMSRSGREFETTTLTHNRFGRPLQTVTDPPTLVLR